jgi:hypothetical protein
VSSLAGPFSGATRAAAGPLRRILEAGSETGVQQTRGEGGRHPFAARRTTAGREGRGRKLDGSRPPSGHGGRPSAVLVSTALAAGRAGGQLATAVLGRVSRPLGRKRTAFVPQARNYGAQMRRG